MNPENVCEPREHDGNTYYCGKLLAMRSVESPEERCLDATFVCIQCYDFFTTFLDEVQAARTRESVVWEGG